MSGIPYYLYKGLNLQNGLLLLNKGINTDFLTLYLKKNTLPPITKNGERYFIITTSIDDVNQNNIEKHLYKEGDIYKLPESNVIKYFIDTSTKNKYKPGENIEVTNSIYLEAEVK